MRVQMSKRRVKQQNALVTGLFKLAGRRKKMDDVFVNHVCQSTRKKKLCTHTKNIYIYIHSNRQTNSITNNICDVCFVFSYTVYLVVHFNFIKRPVFKAPEFPCLQYKHCNRYLYQSPPLCSPWLAFYVIFYVTGVN